MQQDNSGNRPIQYNYSHCIVVRDEQNFDIVPLLEQTHITSPRFPRVFQNIRSPRKDPSTRQYQLVSLEIILEQS
jgi:hypothetical protein